MMKKESVEKIGSLEVPKHVIYRKLREFANLLTFCAFAPYMPSGLCALRDFPPDAPYLCALLTRLARFIFASYLRAFKCDKISY